ncbi:MAG: amine dehydrogenase [Rhodoblastus sp.]|nr:amine dehydrogenase [Rhodoblastus sp.]
MKLLDKLFEQQTRHLAQRSSRRGMLKAIGGLLVGAGTIPLLPVARAAAADAPGRPTEKGDPASCDYWRYCAIDGFLCSCCGGSENTCPPGTEMSPVTWIGTCRNPADGRNYVISYNDCCGKTTCGRCLCNSNVRERPGYLLGVHNDINWCMANQPSMYHCTVSVIVGVAG